MLNLGLIANFLKAAPVASFLEIWRRGHDAIDYYLCFSKSIYLFQGFAN
jgi:hypothetical protein